MQRQKTVHRYSQAFKQKVIAEIESGQLTLAEAQRIYDIKSYGTIRYWLKRYGKHHLLPKIVRIEMRDEKDKLKELEKEKQELESALAQAHLKILCLESLIDVAEDHYQVNFKKNFGQKASPNQSKDQKKRT